MTNDQHADLMTVLSEIRDLLRVLATPVEDPLADEAGSACEHPEEHRTEFSRPGHRHWICGECGFEYDSRATTAPALTPGADAKG